MKQRGALRTQRTAKDLADLLIGFMADTSALQICPFTKYIYIYIYIYLFIYVHHHNFIKKHVAQKMIQ